MTIPSVPGIFNKSKPKTGDVLAIEPFATNGAGHVISGGGSNIYLCTESLKSRLIRDNKTMMIFNKMKNRFKTLPFAQRWLVELFNNCDITLKKLKILGLIKHYPQLVEAKKGIVTQKEHTIIIDEDGCEITT
jgi:methionyl aminopeptidase